MSGVRPSGPAHYVGVIGASEAGEPERELALAVGGALAEAGAIVVCGGRGGVMEAACMGAKRAGGLTVGILPGSDRTGANPYVDVALPTGLGELRNGLVVRCSEALVAVGGSWGTLSEIAFAMRTGRSVVALGSWEELPSDPLPAGAAEVRAGTPTTGSPSGSSATGSLLRAGDPIEAAELAVRLAAGTA